MTDCLTDLKNKAKGSFDDLVTGIRNVTGEQKN
jgi:hypothetical protein